MSKPEVENLFSLCDSESKGYLTMEDLRKVCPQLDDNDLRFIFTELDQDGSGKIEKLEFLRGFQDTVQHGESHGLNGMQRRASVAVEDPPMFLRDEQMFDSESDSTSSRPAIRVFDEEHYHSESDTNINIDFSVPCQEEVLVLYEQLQSSGVPALLRKFERVVGSFHKELSEKKHENERLQRIYASEREMYNRRMEEMESEVDQQLELTEMKARQEERDRLTKEKEEMRQRMSDEMSEMRNNIERLQKMEKALERENERLNHQKELSDKLKVVNEENNDLRQNLAENHLELAMIKSELAQVRCEFDQKQDELSARRDQASHATEESESVRKQLQLLFDANRKLHETNESLRDALDSRASVLRQFNLRTPSPGLLSSNRNSVENFQTSTNVFRSVPLHAISTEEQVPETSLILDDAHSLQGLDTPGDLMGLNDANGPAERTFRIVMCGDAAVGKSSFVMRVIRRQFTNQLPSTLGVDFHVKTVNVDGRNVALQLWDTAGQERFRSLCKSYFRRADGAILVYDVCAEQSFLRVRDWIETIKESTERSIPIILVGNKVDMRISTPGSVAKTDGASMAAAMGVLFMETSALDGSNIDNAMLALTRELMAVEDVEIRSTGVVLNPAVAKKGGCFSKCRGS
ncbi:Ras and EF-hand domain-containing protein homolog [Caenorhabditis elegans]|uniref:Ras and EF-hand domain-containing protein homolog n=2 Tax=Caenorhabditis elegans TaxID=6239 RepID=RASEF_CAEEL|nr:Ras and EF-hand domain-containing protein homolog [Caenorhabditis elegans]Q22908.3 RecName: Full=Ras and EF-hand domain-containing protein homolog; Flags: Precursor [Caenorhabditis elegans]CCD66473.2 Ras and EF-hand domain-containing protein homolog [Caenorhabditis elegans]